MSSQSSEKESLPSLLSPLLPAQTPPSRRSKPNNDDLVLPAGDADNSPSLTPASAPSKTRSPLSPSPLPLRQLLLLNQSPIRRPRSRRLQMDVDNLDPEDLPPRLRSCRNQSLAANMAPMVCASPRNTRRSRRRLEKDDREVCVSEENIGKVRRRTTAMRKRSSKSGTNANRKERLIAVVLSSTPSPSSPPPGTEPNKNGDQDQRSDIVGTWKFISDLVLWKDVAKSSLWFGVGSLFFLPSCFSKDVNFNIISAISHLCLFILAMAFFRDSIHPRSEENQKQQRRQKFVLKEENVLHITRILLPTVNAGIAMAQDVFSGDPSMTLKVAPVLAFTAKYGHFITPWRLSATGFFISFTMPKLYSCYSHQMQKLVASRISYVCEAWKASQHKKIAASSAAIVFWNMFGAKTRILAVFIATVIIQYHRKKKATTPAMQEIAEEESK